MGGRGGRDFPSLSSRDAPANDSRGAARVTREAPSRASAAWSPPAIRPCHAYVAGSQPRPIAFRSSPERYLHEVPGRRTSTVPEAAQATVCDGTGSAHGRALRGALVDTLITRARSFMKGPRGRSPTARSAHDVPCLYRVDSVTCSRLSGRPGAKTSNELHTRAIRADRSCYRPDTS